MPVPAGTVLAKGFNPLHIVDKRLEALAEASREAPRLVSMIAANLEPATSEKKLLLHKLSEGINSIVSRPWARQTLRLKSVAPEPRLLSQLLLQLSALMHLAYLATGSSEAEWASIYLYSGHKLLEAAEEGLDTQQLKQVAASFAAAGQLLLEGRSNEALALLAKILRRRLHVQPPTEASSQENSEAWAAALRMSHLLDIAPYVDGRLLDAWGYYRLLDETLEETP